MQEELGLDLIGKIDYVTSEYFVDSSGISSINNLFHYKYDDFPTVTPCEREVPWFAWMTREEVLSNTLSPEWLKTLIKLV